MAEITIGLEREPAGYGNGYLVTVDEEPRGRVVRVAKESHIRRGRLQASPWWRPLDIAGQPVGERTRRGDLVDYQTRNTAIDRLLEATSAPPEVCPHCQYPLSEHGGAEAHMHREEPCDCEPICPIPPQVVPTSVGES